MQGSSPGKKKVMIDSATNCTDMPSFSESQYWADLFGNDLYSSYRDPTSDVSLPSDWTSLAPEQWSKEHVCEWLQYCCDTYKLDATCIPFPHFNVSGLQLCSMSKDDFTESAGACGHFLYSVLQDIRTHGTPLLTSIEKAPPPRDVECEENMPKNPEVGKRQRPANHSRPGMHSSHLWEFMRDLLLSPEDNNGILDWEDQQQGIFRVVKSEALAQMWGQRKRNSRMNYEKLSRALRHYYKTGILERVDRRLVYKFGKNAYGWH
ncbi:ETS-related transcription factor Elf-5 [Hyperolius riggenbachi]|uniref:ETS-related transcription factor Elf-5 n=1 Tax=Hyperolius riggenbachi TaxID=752182 RepID=UPI0035A3CFB5